MKTSQLIDKLNTTPEQVSFNEVIETIETDYDYTPAKFTNGGAINEAGSNEGSCKIFAFAQLNQLDENKTLHCFGNYYRKDVLDNPDGTDHANIRNFIRSGWPGIVFESVALRAK